MIFLRHIQQTLKILLCGFLNVGIAYSQFAPYPQFSVTISGAGSSGYYFITPIRASARNVSASTQFNLILDSKGNVVYYKKQDVTPKQVTCDFKLHSNGLMSYYFNDKFYLLNAGFKIIDSIYCKNGLIRDNHELLILPNDHYIILGTEELKMDLSPYKMFNNKTTSGSSTATVNCGVIQEQNADKKVVFEWHAAAHFKFNDVDTFYLGGPEKVTWTHCNAVEVDRDGNLLLSSKNFNEITKISRADGSVIWRFGGARNQFQFTNDNGKFLAQHDVRRLPNGNITLFDNGRGAPRFHPAAAREYSLDEKGLKATLVWKHVEDNTSNSAMGLGNVQRLTNGNTLVNYGINDKSAVLFNVVTPSGEKVFEIAFRDTLRSYRAFNYTELPFKLKRPEIKETKVGERVYLDAGNGYTEFLWSTGERTQKIVAWKNGVYSVFVPIGDGGFISSPPYQVKK